MAAHVMCVITVDATDFLSARKCLMHYVTGLLLTLTTESHGVRDVMDLEHHIHYLETVAYSSILKAFIAQSDLLTWGKEGLMTELRKELNITDVEHGEILTKINSDELIKRIREQRKLSSHAKDYIKASAPGCASASMGNSMIRFKNPSSATFYAQKKMSRSQASLTSIPIPSSMPPKFHDDPLTAEFSHGSVEKSMEMFNYNVQLPPVGGGRALKGKYQLQKDFHRSNCVKLKKRSDLIQIRATDKVIHDVSKILTSLRGGAEEEGDRVKNARNFKGDTYAVRTSFDDFYFVQ
ncbi:Protein EMSY-LIKE 3, partial [Mucuna pruriens]